MRKLFVLMLAVLLAVAVAIGLIVVASNNNKVSTAPKATATAVPTATTAPQVTEVPAPKATATAVPTVMPMATAMPNIATAVPTNVPTNVSSYEISNETIVTDPDGSIRQMMIYASDLNKVGYVEIVISQWNGVVLNCNTKGIVGEIYGRDSYAFNELKAGVRDEVTVKSFFNANGEVFANNVREGYATKATQIGVYNLTNVRFVQLTGEDYYRLVVVGNKSSDGGNDYPVVTPAPTPNFPDDPIEPEPSHNPETTTPVATATPAPTATPNYAMGDLPDFPDDVITSNPVHNLFEVVEPTQTPNWATGDLPEFPD